MSKSTSAGALQVVLLLAALLALTALSVWLKPQNLKSDTIVNRSVYNSGPSGLRAWALAAQKAGIHSTRWERPFTDIGELPGPATMLMVQPLTMAADSVAYGKTESLQLLDWVARGNMLILLDDFERAGSRALLQRLGLRTKPAFNMLKNGPLLPSALTPPLDRFVGYPLHSGSNRHFPTESFPNSNITVLLQRSPEQPVLIRLPYKKGLLILGTATDLVENRRLHQNEDGNFQFLANLIVSENRPLFINEFVHGYDRTSDIFAYFREKTPVGALMMQFVFVLLFLLWLSFTRWTPVLAPDEGRAPKTGGLGQFINSLANIYYRRHAASLTIRPQLAQVAATLRKRHQIELHESAKIQNLLESLPEPYSSNEAEKLLATLQEAQDIAVPEADVAVAHRELLQLSKHLTELQERLQYAKR